MYIKNEKMLEKWLKRHYKSIYNYWKTSVLDNERLSKVLQTEYPKVWKEWNAK